MTKIIMSSQEDEDSDVLTIDKVKVKKPRKFKVLLHNDDYTTMEFVIYILQKHFFKSMAEAQEIMMKIHNTGAGVCGIYTFEIAETKVAKVISSAKENGHPLLCTYGPE